MQIPDLLAIYQTKTDEELIELASSSEQLTHEARISLESELSRRGIGIPTLNYLEHADARKEQSQDRKPQTTGAFLAEVVQTYHHNFWLFFKISAPATIISTLAYLAARAEVREIFRPLPRGPAFLVYRFDILKIVLCTYSSYVVSWIAFCFSFAAICTAVQNISAGSDIKARHCFADVSHRVGPFLRLCLLLFFLMLALQGGAVLLSMGVFRFLHRLELQTDHLLISLISYICAGLGFLVLARFALAVPALVLHRYPVGKAMFRSDELTQRKWLILAALLAKSLIGSYVAAMCPFWLVANIDFPIVLPDWFPWLLTAASVVCVTAVEPAMFVGFALLYVKKSQVLSSREVVALQMGSS
jgi:hypothetical protein